MKINITKCPICISKYGESAPLHAIMPNRQSPCLEDSRNLDNFFHVFLIQEDTIIKCILTLGDSSLMINITNGFVTLRTWSLTDQLDQIDYLDDAKVDEYLDLLRSYRLFQ